MKNRNFVEFPVVSISRGNRKMGAIPSVSLPPVKTCAAGVPCVKDCYACKMCRIYKNVRDSYENNYKILIETPDIYWAQVRAAVSVSPFFRFHVSGDIPTAEYFAEMVETARMFPNSQLLAFTKQYAIVNEWIRENGSLPENLHIIFSEWKDGSGWKMENPYNLPTSTVIFKDTEIMNAWKICGGNCFMCACRGMGCWELKNGETVAFYKH